MWEESKHPRDKNGQFAEKEKAGKLLGVELNKTFKMPKAQLDYMAIHPYFKNAEMQVVPLEKLVKENDLENPDVLSNRKRSKKYNKKQNNTKEDIIYGKLQDDGKIRIADGRHRIFALYNSGYDSIEMPILKP